MDEAVISNTATGSLTCGEAPRRDHVIPGRAEQLSGWGGLSVE